jgi:hypothetical protein
VRRAPILADIGSTFNNTKSLIRRPPIISLGMAWMIPTARIEGAFPLSYLVRGSEVIPTAAVERPLSEVGVPGAKESPH